MISQYLLEKQVRPFPLWLGSSLNIQVSLNFYIYTSNRCLEQHLLLMRRKLLATCFASCEKKTVLLALNVLVAESLRCTCIIEHGTGTTGARPRHLGLLISVESCAKTFPRYLLYLAFNAPHLGARPPVQLGLTILHCSILFTLQTTLLWRSLQ